MRNTGDVRVQQSTIAGAGGGLYAAKSFAAGDVILSIDRPTVAELYDERTNDTCAWCFGREGTPSPDTLAAERLGLPGQAVKISVSACGRCKRVKNCSKTCQKHAWETSHKRECNLFARLPPLPKEVRGTMRLIRLLQEGDAMAAEILRMKSKVDDVKKYSPARCEYLRRTAEDSWRWSTGAEKPSEDVVRELATILSCYSLNISSLETGPVGSALDPVACIINHSCDPNATSIWAGSQLTVRSLTAIQEGEEIFFDYIYAHNPFTVRQWDLKEGWYFQCACTRCRKGPTLPEDSFNLPADELPDEWRRLADKLLLEQSQAGADMARYFVGDTKPERRLAALQAEAYRVFKQYDEFNAVGPFAPSQQTLPDLNRVLRMCLGSRMWSITRPPVPRLLYLLYDFHRKSGDLARAFAIGAKTYFCIDPMISPNVLTSHRVANMLALSELARELDLELNGAVGSATHQGVDLNAVYLGLLDEGWKYMPLTHGTKGEHSRYIKELWNAYFGESSHIMTPARFRHIPPEAARSMVRGEIKDHWPSFRAFAEGIDILSIM